MRMSIGPQDIGQDDGIASIRLGSTGPVPIAISGNGQGIDGVDLPHNTWAGFASVAFITDVFSRHIVDWRVSNSLHSNLAWMRWRWPSGGARLRI